MSSYYTTSDIISPNSFMMFPKALLHKKYKDVSLDAKVLYSILLDRVSLSIKNQLVDVDGNVYIVCKQSEIQTLLGFAKQKVQKMFKELEDNLLIDRKKQGSNLPDLIFVRKLSTESVDNHVDNGTDRCISTLRDENHTKPSMKIIRPTGMKISPLNNTNINNTELSDTKSIYHEQSAKDIEPASVSENGLIDSTNAREVVCNQICESAIAENIDSAESKLALSNIVSLMTEVYSRRYGKISVNGSMMAYVDLMDRFKELNQFHIEYVLECLGNRNKASQPIVNLKAYLATALYNAPVTMNDYYDAQVQYLKLSADKMSQVEKYNELDALAW